MIRNEIRIKIDRVKTNYENLKIERDMNKLIASIYSYLARDLFFKTPYKCERCTFVHAFECRESRAVDLRIQLQGFRCSFCGMTSARINMARAILSSRGFVPSSKVAFGTRFTKLTTVSCALSPSLSLSLPPSLFLVYRSYFRNILYMCHACGYALILIDD